jgi:putative ABC transport system permease protein
MLGRDIVEFTLRSVVSHRMRSGLTALGIAVGVTAVVLLTSIGGSVSPPVCSTRFAL